jgi:NAD(P)-dependent dehydrogenase (short-subunit alcohol dehydrogenase family)
VTAEASTAIAFVGTGAPESAALAEALGATDVATCPAPPADTGWGWDVAGTIEAWTDELRELPARDRVVVCTWPDPAPAVALAALDPDAWRRQVEWPTALWYSTLVAVSARGADGGSVVVVADRPASLDVLGRGAEVTVAEGVANVVRSLAAREGGRGVRVNTLFSALHTSTAGLDGSPPPLASFPGTVDREVAGAVRMLLSDDAAGITGAVISATGGRR